MCIGLRIVLALLAALQIPPSINVIQAQTGSTRGLEPVRENTNRPDPASEIDDQLLPPLEKIIDAAIQNSPVLKQQDALINKNEYRLKSVKQSWSDAISVGASTQYGAFGNVALDALSVGYQAGVYIKVSLFDIIGRSNQIGVFVEERNIALHKREELKRLIRQRVTSLYNKLRLSKRLVQIKSNGRESTRVHHQMVEKKFIKGDYSVSEYARVVEIATKMNSDYEIARAEFMRFYVELEEFVGKKIVDLEE